MKTLFISILIITTSIFTNFVYAANSCRPPVNFHKPQFIVGYGSLMEEASKRRSDSNTSANYPVLVKGFERGWFIGPPKNIVTVPATFLGVIPDETKKFNASIYSLNDPKNIIKYDKREAGYCRDVLNYSQIKFLSQVPLNMRKGQIWVYTVPKSAISNPSKNAPIVQSYVDIFINGCMELQKKYKLKSFVKQCITTTSGWSKHWVNDRIYPRRPFIHQPHAIQIDLVLHKYLPQYYDKIKIE